MARVRSACPLDCPDTCSLAVDVEDGRIGWVGAAPAAGDVNSFTQGFICAKVKRYAERVHGPARVLRPRLRTGPKGTGGWREVSWEEALDVVAARMRHAIERWGPGAVVPFLYGSSSGLLAASGLSPLLFRALGASKVADTICAATMGEARARLYGRLASAEPADLDDTRLVVLWGANPSVANTHLVPLIQRAQRRGAEVVVVDPRRTTIARRATRHLAVRPGTDVVVALALARFWDETGRIDRTFCAAHVTGLDAYLAAAAPWTLERAAEVSGVDAGDLRWLAERYADVRPALLRPGWGLERNRNGGAACTAVLALPALVGQFGVPGSGLLSSIGGEGPVSTRGLADAVLDSRGKTPARVLNMNRLGADLCDPHLDPPVAVLFVQGANPAVSAPAQAKVVTGLGREEVFTVVHDQVMTDTAQLADVVLPATTHFETAELVTSYGTPTVERVAPIIPRVGESRTNDEVAAGLAVRLGLDPDRFDPSPDRLIEAVGGANLPAGVTATRTERVIAFRDSFPTYPDRRVRLVGGDGSVPTYAELDDDHARRHPLTLITPATHATINSILGEVAPAAAVIRLHPDDAASRGIGEGDAVRVWNAGGEVRTEARLDPDVRPGVVVMPKGTWRGQLEGGWTANVLVPDTLDPLAGGACFNDARVEVARA